MHNKGVNKHAALTMATIALMLFSTTAIVFSSSILTIENAFAQPVNPIITDPNAPPNVKVLGDAPAKSLGSLYQQQIIRTQVPDKELVELEALDAEISGDLLRSEIH
jgi:Killing trait